jgi:fructokinase
MKPFPLIVTLGEILVDMFPSELGKKLAEVPAFHPKPGGAPANVAVAAARLGTASAFIGKVGTDAFGDLLVRTLEDQGVDTRGMRRDPQARTTLAFIAMPDENHAEFVFYRNPGADLRLRPDELDEALLENARAFHFGSLSLVDDPARSATMAALRLAKAAGALVSFDVNFRPSLWETRQQALTEIEKMLPEAHLLKVNEVELKLLTGCDNPADGAPQLLARGPELVVVTLGTRGSYFCCQQAQGQVPAFQVKTVDSTGCGDAFIASLLTRLVSSPGGWRSRLTGPVLREDFRFANATGALTAQTQGVIPALPTREQVEAFLRD